MDTQEKELTLKLDPKSAKKFSSFFKEFDKEQTLNSLGIESYKVLVTSLEDIFHKTGSQMQD